MDANNNLRELIDSILRQSFEEMREGIVARVLEAVRTAAPQPQTSASSRIAAAIRSLESVTSQSDILRTLLDESAPFAERRALFIVRGGSGVVWQARGFTETVRALALDATSGSAAQAIASRAPLRASAEEFDLGNAPCVLVPLVIRDRVAALLYADSAADALDADALEILVRAAGNWIELAASRPAAPAQPAAPVVAAAPAPQPAPAVTAVPQAPPAADAPPATSPVAAPAPPVSASAPDDETHRKARRFAKLLVDEIKLYNGAKLTAGKLHGDLYERLRDDIEKSREAYQRRYGASVATDYFSEELIRGLADGNPALLNAPVK